MIFIDDYSFAYVLFFILLFNVLKYSTRNSVVLSITLLCGSVVILNLVLDFASLWTIGIIALLVFITGLYLSKNTKNGKAVLTVSIFSLVLLFVLRNYQIVNLELVHRIGLSYILFRFIHFLVDSEKHLIPQYNVLTFLNYIFFFPSFLAGPIDRYPNFQYWNTQPRKNYRIVLMKAGSFKIALGIIKKFLIVPMLLPYALDFSLFTQSMPWHTALLCSLIAYSFYILFDFSGYSDIAIGTAYLIGIKTPENFNWPYLSSNISVFWKRWHMTFSQFLYQYIFKPVVVGLSLNFNNSPRLLITCIGYLITFIICGLWHGNTYNFLLWGLWHAGGLIVYKLWSIYVSPSIIQRSSAILRKVYYAISIAVTFLFVTIGWFFFHYRYNEIKLIAQNFNEAQSANFYVKPFQYEGKRGFEVMYEPSLAQDSLIELEFRSGLSSAYNRLPPQRLSSDNRYYVLPVDQMKGLYSVRARSRPINLEDQSRTTDWSGAIEFINPDLNVKYYNHEDVGDRVLSESTLGVPLGYVSQKPKARPFFYEGYGWCLVLEYLPNPLYKVEIWHRKKGTSVWELAQKDRPGIYSFMHLHGTLSFDNVNRNLEPGEHEVKLRYLFNNRKSPWIYTMGVIPNYYEGIK